MRVALIIPPAPFLINPRMFLPLGPLYLSSVLKQQGHSVEIFDLTGGEFLPFIESDVFGISVNTATFPFACKILGQIKERNKNSRVVAGGSMATIDPYACLRVGFDGVVVGEGERAILKIASEEKIIKEPFIENLDEIPFPDRDALLHNYHAELNGETCTNIITSRGCPYRCIFCVKNWGTKVRFHSAQYVLKEAALIKKRYGLKALWFYDDEFLLNKKRDFEIFKGLKELEIIFRIFSRSNLIDEKSADILSRCGCREVLIGVESASDKIKKIIKKGTTAELDKKAIKNLNKRGVRVKTTFMLGLPFESDETIEETWRFCEEMEPYVADFDFSILVPYPGTEIYSYPERFGLKFEMGYHPYKTKPEEYICTVSTSSLSREEISQWRHRLEQRFKPKEKLR